VGRITSTLHSTCAARGSCSPNRNLTTFAVTRCRLRRVLVSAAKVGCGPERPPLNAASIPLLTPPKRCAAVEWSTPDHQSTIAHCTLAVTRWRMTSRHKRAMEVSLFDLPWLVHETLWCWCLFTITILSLFFFWDLYVLYVKRTKLAYFSPISVAVDSIVQQGA
jgi:hypothetical protein